MRYFLTALLLLAVPFLSVQAKNYEISTGELTFRVDGDAAKGVFEAKGTEVSWTVEPDRPWQGARVHIFARVKAYSVDGSGEELFSQPFMLT